MQANAKCSDDPWMRTIGLLSVLSGAPDSGMAEIAALAAGRPRKGAMPPFMSARSDVQVQLIDRPSQSTATIAWRDSTHCSYGDQVWHACRARTAGVCAMSGRAIRPGDAIYKPRPCRPAPLNTGAMILRSVLHEADTL